MELLENPLVKPLLENTHGLKRARREQALKILGAALHAVEPGAAIRNILNYDSTNQKLLVANRSYDLQQYERIYIIGAGKAGWPMAAALADILGERLTQGIVNVKQGHGPEAGKATGRIEIIEARHPIPDEAGVEGAAKMVKLLQGVGERDLVLAVISGGGSASGSQCSAGAWSGPDTRRPTSAASSRDRAR